MPYNQILLYLNYLLNKQYHFSQLKAEQQHYDNELDLDIYVKLFGTDAVFLSLGNDKGFDFNRAVDQFVNFFVNGIDQAKHLSVS